MEKCLPYDCQLKTAKATNIHTYIDRECNANLGGKGKKIQLVSVGYLCEMALFTFSTVNILRFIIDNKPQFLNNNKIQNPLVFIRETKESLKPQ